ncbi:MAG: hypothetical protein Kow0068_23510 [Marinilabiliales bacterium]
MENKQKSRLRVVRHIIDGTLLTKESVVKQIPFIFFLIFLAMIYISNSYNAEKVVRETNKLQKELKELRSEQLGISSELMYISKQSEVLKLIKEKNIDLKEAKEPPKIIVIE